MTTVLYTHYHYITNCNMIAKLWGLKEEREDEVIQSIRQSL